MDRRTGTLSEGTSFQQGDHVCWAYGSDVEHRRVLASYLSEGLVSGNRVAYFAPRGREDRVLGFLDVAGFEPRRLLAQGRLVIGSAEQAYLPGGTFDPGSRVAAYRTMVRDALRDGYNALRVAGEVGWLVADPRAREHWPAYELRADLLTAELPFIAMCAYDTRECGASAAKTAAALHSLALGPNGSAFHLHGRTDGGIAISGEIDLTGSATARTALVGAAPDTRSPTLDLTKLRFADVRSICSIAAAAELIVARHGGVELRGASATFQRVWRLLDFDTTNARFN